MISECEMVIESSTSPRFMALGNGRVNGGEACSPQNVFVKCKITYSSKWIQLFNHISKRFYSQMLCSLLHNMT